MSKNLSLMLVLILMLALMSFGVFAADPRHDDVIGPGNFEHGNQSYFKSFLGCCL